MSRVFLFVALAVAGFILIYKGMKNLYFGAQDWRGPVATIIGGFIWAIGLGIFLTWLVGQ